MLKEEMTINGRKTPLKKDVEKVFERKKEYFEV